MIYILRKKNLINLTEIPRNLEEESSELLYTFEDISLNNTIFLNLRPWQNLELNEPWYYKLSLLPKLPEIIYSKDILEEQKEISPSEILKLHNKYISALTELGLNEKIRTVNGKIIYSCDVLNLLEEEYGSENIRKACIYINLPSESKLFLKKLKLFGRRDSNMLNELRNSNINVVEEIWDLLPSWIIEDIKLFGEDIKPGNYQKNPEFKISKAIVSNDINLAELFYEEFKLSEDLTGDEIKARIGKIYEKYNIPGVPKIQDLWNYFEISQSRSRVTGIRGYRINTRKIIKNG